MTDKVQQQAPARRLISRRSLLKIGGAAALTGLTPSGGQAATYPTGPISVIIPLPPGGVTDVLLRLCSEHFRRDLGQPFVIENVPGATSNLGVSRVARARPDGQTVLMCPSSPISTNVVVFKSLPFDPDKDLEPIILTSENPLALVVHSSFPAKTVADYVAYAKAHPGELNYGTSGIGSPHHFCGEYLASSAGVKLKHVPYKGSPETAADVTAGHIMSAFTSYGLMTEQAKAGTVRVLAITSDQRSPSIPDIPTIGETVSGFTGAPGTWNAMFVPAGTPKETRDILNREMNVALRDPELLAAMQKLFVFPIGGTPEAVTEKVKRERQIAKDIAEKIGLEPQ